MNGFMERDRRVPTKPPWVATVPPGAIAVRRLFIRRPSPVRWSGRPSVRIRLQVILSA